MPSAEYMRDYRARNAPQAELNRRRNLARARALESLREAHPVEFFALEKQHRRAIEEGARRQAS